MHRMVLTLLVVLAAAALVQPAMGVEAEQSRDACGAPCGTISPIIDMRFPDKKDCGSDLVLGVQHGPESCMSPPREGEPVVVEGVLNWYWDVTNEGTYPADPGEDIDITFYSTAGNPDWLKFRVEPARFTLTAADLADPQYFRTTGEGADTVVYYWFEAPITVTFTRAGDPVGETWQRIQDTAGLQPLYLRAQSTASGDRITEGYGLEEFRFHVDNDPDLAEQRSTPLSSMVLILPTMAAVASFMRRRW